MLKVYTQIGAVAFAVVLGAKRAIQLQGFAADQAGFVTSTMLQLVAGASLLRFAMDQNEAQGLGDGISMLISAGIGASESAANSHRLHVCVLTHCQHRGTMGARVSLQWALRGMGGIQEGDSS